MRYQLLASLLKEAPIPVIATEASDFERCMNDAANIVRARQAIASIREADKASGYIQYSLESLREMLHGMNEQGGLNRTQFDLAQLTMESQCQRLEIPVVSFGVESAAFTNEAPMQKVSLEELDEVIKLIDGNHAALAADAREACESLCDTLKTAIPNAAARMYETVSHVTSNGANYKLNVSVESQEVIQCFMNGESFPEDFSLHMSSYCSLGKRIVGPYAKACVEAISHAAELGKVSFESIKAFKETAAPILKNIKDPQNTLNQIDLQICLPGEGPLFAEESTGLESHEIVPQDPSEYVDVDKEVPTSIKALSLEQIDTIGHELYSLAMECDAAQLESDIRNTGAKLDAAIESFETAFKNAPTEVANVVSTEAQAISSYLETVRKSLHVPMYFMSNTVQTLNAFSGYVALSQEALSENERGTDVATPKEIQLDANKVSDLSGAAKGEHPSEAPHADVPSKVQDGGAPKGNANGSNPLPASKAVAENPEQSGNEPGPNVPDPANIDLDANKVSNLSGQGKPEAGGKPLESGEPSKAQDGGAPAGTQGDKAVDGKAAQSGNERGSDAPAPKTIELDANKVSDLSGVGKAEHPSMEAGGVKLRTGMKVKYSGGYGKIVKIFDRPTRYKGEIHHCDKTHPKYEVKSDDGKRLSLHKASALTPV